MPRTFSLVPGGSDVAANHGFRNLTILDQPDVPCAVVRANGIAMAELATVFDPVFRELPQLITDSGRSIVAPALAAYFRIGGVDSSQATTDLVAGFPVDEEWGDPTPLGDTGLTVEPWSIPGGRIAVFSHIGGYDTLADSWQAVIRTMTERGLDPKPPFWEVYVSRPGPGADASTMRTDLFVSLIHNPM